MTTLDHEGASSGHARIEEVDAALESALGATVLGIAITALVGFPAYGWGYTLAFLLPALVLGLRRTLLDQLIGVHRGTALLVAAALASGVGASSFSGGIGSSAVFFAGLLAMFGMIMFPGQRWLVALGAAGVAAVALIDLAIGRQIDGAVLTAALVLSIAIPAGAQRIVGLETLYRAHSVIDPLTGCLNRRALSNRTVEIEEQAARIPVSLSVVSFDIDHFKRINDGHGHSVGDRVLSHVAYTVRKELPRSEFVYRTGGEEFVLILLGTEVADAVSVADRLRVAIAADTVEGVSVTASFGVAGAASPFTVDELIAAADHQLYAAKHAGRNQVAHSHA